MNATYRLDVSIKCADSEDDEFVEIGFAGVDWSSIDGAVYALDSLLQCRQWETTPGMPDPRSVDPS